MKTFRILTLIMLAIAAVFIQSCSKDDDDKNQNDITLTVDTDRSTAAAGEVVIYDISAKSSSGINKLKIVNKTAGVTLKDSTVSSNNFGIEYYYTLPANSTGKVDLEFTVTNTRNQTQSVTKTVTIGGTAPATYSGVVLGDQRNSGEGSFFSTKDGKVYKTADVKGNTNNQANVDILYYHGFSDATVVSPDDENLNLIFSAFDDWAGPKNATRFKKASYFTKYSEINSAELLKSTFEANTDEARKNISDLSEGHSVLFKTAAGKHGIFTVKNIVKGGSSVSNGTMTIDVKVEK